ncbi:MAG: lysophospholipid acyltransferase family protein [Campylobacteraceae bacterium]
MSLHKHDYPLSKRIGAKVIPFFVSIFHRVLLFTCKRVYELPSEDLQIPTIWVAWHGQFAFVPNLYRKIKPNAKINVIVSEHLHGDIAINSYKRFNFNYIRGSSRKGALKALLQAIDVLKKGDDVGITPDGPKGPVHTISDGVIVLASKCEAPVVAVGWVASSFWQLKSWDEAKIPKPFSTITFRVSKPLYLQNLEKEEAKEVVKNALFWCMQK